jgi:hypothetical protein
VRRILAEAASGAMQVARHHGCFSKRF